MNDESDLRVNDESEEKEDVDDCKSNKGVVERRLHLRPQQNQDDTFSISYIIPLNLFVDCQFSWTNKETFCIPMLPSIPIDPTIGSATWVRGCSFHKAIEGSTVLIMDLAYIIFNLIK